MIDGNIELDIRKTGNARWFDQKCKVDNITFIADCILEFNEKNVNEFTTSDIRNQKYSKENLLKYFSKPEIDKADNEYDKFFSQPIKLLSYAGILKENKYGNKYIYEIIDEKQLEKISINEKNSNDFLYEYIKEVLKKSDFYNKVLYFFDNQNIENLKKLKKEYFELISEYTPINGETESNRIFNPLLNILAFNKQKLGTIRGNLSKEIITFDELMYNRLNFRDLYTGKPKGISREEYNGNFDKDLEENNNYNISKAKKIVRKYVMNSSKYPTEIAEQDYKIANYPQMHHIFKVSDNIEISSTLENIIAITPTQHYNFAHFKNDTKSINKNYQLKCLIAKLDNIYLSINR